MPRQVGRLDLLERRRVRVLSWADLCEQHGVASVDVVQLDCEGKDCAIIRGLLAHCSREPGAYPGVLQFEANHLTEEAEVAGAMATFLPSELGTRRRADPSPSGVGRGGRSTPLV